MRKGHVQIRGLSACTNCVCRRSRDAQAAKNIANNLRKLIEGETGEVK